jgi:hypothetical protein
LTYGLRLAGTAADGAILEMLVDAHPELVDAPWFALAEPSGRGSVIFCEALSPAGLELARIEERSGGFSIEHAGSEEFWIGPARSVRSLAEAIRPLRVDGDPIAAEALFVINLREAASEGSIREPGSQEKTRTRNQDPFLGSRLPNRESGESARALLERLLLLGRDDAKIIRFEDLLGVRVIDPPLYLLMRARDQREEQITAYASEAPGVWIEWGHAHPLASRASHADRTVLIDRDGTWHFGPRELPERRIYEAIEPKLDAPRIDLSPSPHERRFVIQLRFAPGPEHEPELWLIDAERFFALEHFLQTAAEEEIRRITFARLDRGDGRPLYLLRERPKPGTTRLGERISELVGSRGFAKNTGTENLFLPVGRRLVPKVGREELRRMLELEASALVILDEDRDGPKVLRIAELDEEPLAAWLDYVATDRRVDLDRLLERTIFSFPPMDVERPAPSIKASPALPPPVREPRVLGSKKSRPATPAKEIEKPAEVSLDELAEIREQARALEATIAKGGCDDPSVWQRLATLHSRLGDTDEAAVCLESALFFGKQNTPAIAELVELRAKTYEQPNVPLVDLVVKEAHSPREAAFLAARFTEAVARGEHLFDDMVQVALQIFADPGLPISRRMAWVALSSWHASVDDKLGLTRAREALLGAINDRGLSELFDLPRFVRYALALEDDERGTNTERARVEQLDALERLFEGTFEYALPEFDSMANYVRVVFAVGMMRLGSASHARALVRSVENELAAHDAPNQVLYRLYLARMAFEGTDSDPPMWHAEVGRILSAAEEHARRPAAWLAKRSIWLGRPEDKQEPKLRTMIDRMLEAADDQKKDLGAMLTKLATDRVYRLYDWELTEVVDRTMRIALASGSDLLIEEVLEAAFAQLPSISILAHRIKAIAACLKGAATIEQQGRIEQLVQLIVEISASRDAPWVRDLLLAVRPCLSILKRLGAKEAAARLLASLETVPAATKLDTSLLGSTLADGYLQLERHDRAADLIERSLSLVFDPELDYVSRHEAGSLAIDVLRHWPTYERSDRYRRFAADLDHFKDLYTTSEWFEAHKILVLERIVDAMADSATRQSDRVQAFLDLEEHAVRTKILSDWKTLCGR